MGRKLRRVEKDNPDGLDPVFTAYHTLRRIFDAATVVELEHEGEWYDDVLELPGSGELVDPNDLNPLNGLEQWLLEQTTGREDMTESKSKTSKKAELKLPEDITVQQARSITNLYKQGFTRDALALRYKRSRQEVDTIIAFVYAAE